MGFIGVKKGDVLPIPCGSVSSWYNYGDSDVVVIFMADATKAYVAGEITYFLLTGQQGHLRAFSPEFIAKTYQINADKAKNLVGSQKGVLLIKLSEEEARKIPIPNEEVSNILIHNMDASQPDVEVDNGGKLTTIKGTEFPLLEQVGIDVSRLVLESCATRAPSYATEPQVCYIAKGSGEVQIVGINGKLVLNTKVETSQLFVVPKLFAVVVSADEQGIELVSIVTSTRAVTGEIAGKNSILKTIPSISQMSFNVSQESIQHFLQMLETGTIIVPPMNLY
ncbi:cocosin 1-like [Gossypium arboreum]|nr:cocosin 1-like [Gossypium arboreum]